jgi:hypothetical protein
MHPKDSRAIIPASNRKVIEDEMGVDDWFSFWGKDCFIAETKAAFIHGATISGRIQSLK